MSNGEIELYQTRYYRVLCCLSKRERKGDWLAHIRVKRKDSEEYVNRGFTTSGIDQKSALEIADNKVRNSLIKELEELGAPIEWASPIRAVLIQCRKVNDSILQFGSYCNEFSPQTGNGNDFIGNYSGFWKKLVKDSYDLIRLIEALSPDDKLSLLVSNDSVFEDPSDSWSLEDIDLRIRVFDFFMDPTDQECSAHKKQLDKLADRYAELGWE